MHTEPAIYRESHLRSLLKALSWRVVATTTTGIIAYFITGDVMAAITIGSKAINIGRLHDLIPVTAQVIRAMLIGHNKQKIGAGCHGISLVGVAAVIGSG